LLHVGPIACLQHRGTTPPITSIDPILTLRSTYTLHEATASEAYQTDHNLSAKRRTRLRRVLQGASTESYLNVLPGIPEALVQKFRAIYEGLHHGLYEPTVGRGLFKPFYAQEGDKKRCLLCNHRIKNTTQMVQHIKGIHFEVYAYKCATQGWYVPAYRLPVERLLPLRQFIFLGTGCRLEAAYSGAT